MYITSELELEFANFVPYIFMLMPGQHPTWSYWASSGFTWLDAAVRREKCKKQDQPSQRTGQLDIMHKWVRKNCCALFPFFPILRIISLRRFLRIPRKTEIMHKRSSESRCALFPLFSLFVHYIPVHYIQLTCIARDQIPQNTYRHSSTPKPVLLGRLNLLASVCVFRVFVNKNYLINYDYLICRIQLEYRS